MSYDYDAFQALEALEALEAIDAFAAMHMRKHSKKRASMLQLQLAVMLNMRHDEQLASSLNVTFSLYIWITWSLYCLYDLVAPYRYNLHCLFMVGISCFSFESSLENLGDESFDSCSVCSHVIFFRD